MGPLELSGGLRIFASLVLGIMFGFVIYKAGFHNRKQLFDQFTLQDNKWLKVILFSLSVGAILYYLCYRAGLVALHVKPGFFWASIIAAMICSAGLLICGHIPATALTAFGTGRFHMIWILLGMMLAIPATRVIADFLNNTIFSWNVPFDFNERLIDYFSSPTQVVMWFSCLTLIATLLLEIAFKKKTDD